MAPASRLSIVTVRPASEALVAASLRTAVTNVDDVPSNVRRPTAAERSARCPGCSGARRLIVRAPFGPVTVRVPVEDDPPSGFHLTSRVHSAPAARLQLAGDTDHAPAPAVTAALTFIVRPDAQTVTGTLCAAPVDRSIDVVDRPTGNCDSSEVQVGASALSVVSSEMNSSAADPPYVASAVSAAPISTGVS